MLFMLLYSSYQDFGNCLPDKNVFTLVFTKQTEKLRISYKGHTKNQYL